MDPGIGENGRAFVIYFVGIGSRRGDSAGLWTEYIQTKKLVGENRKLVTKTASKVGPNLLHLQGTTRKAVDLVLVTHGVENRPVVYRSGFFSDDWLDGAALAQVVHEAVGAASRVVHRVILWICQAHKDGGIAEPFARGLTGLGWTPTVWATADNIHGIGVYLDQGRCVGSNSFTRVQPAAPQPLLVVPARFGQAEL